MPGHHQDPIGHRSRLDPRIDHGLARCWAPSSDTHALYDVSVRVIPTQDSPETPRLMFPWPQLIHGYHSSAQRKFLGSNKTEKSRWQATYKEVEHVWIGKFLSYGFIFTALTPKMSNQPTNQPTNRAPFTPLHPRLPELTRDSEGNILYRDTDGNWRHHNGPLPVDSTDVLRVFQLTNMQMAAEPSRADARPDPVICAAAWIQFLGMCAPPYLCCSR
ncbi:hypothetical protein B0H11DRAFT_1941084 [Mycena galericulata]|nr:hypothetical protein B0H11DRAFT_1941084 [Mycena galericulata]